MADRKAIQSAMAALRKNSSFSDRSEWRCGAELPWRMRFLGWLALVSIWIPPLPVIGAGDFEPPLPVTIHWNPPPVLRPDPFQWVSRTPGEMLRRAPQARDRVFPGWTVFPKSRGTVLEEGDEEPWTPADLLPILPPDGMPGQPGPVAALGMLERTVGNGIIVGEVSDATTLNPIAGAVVEIEGSGKTVETDGKGRFEITGLPPGVFNVEASQLGYFSDTTVTTVIEGSPSEVRFGLRVKPTDDAANVFTLEEETVVGEFQGESGGDLFLDLNVDRTISAGLTAEDFAKAPVSDAGEAVEKVSGANIVDGKFAVVRGLADRYVSTTYNGALISSAVPSRKAVRLDLFPTSVLAGIDVNKVYTPDLFGDFGGAAIDIRTRFFPEDPVVQFKLKGEYTPDLPDRILLPADSDLEYFGGLGEDIGLAGLVNADGFLIGAPSAPDGTNAAEGEVARQAFTTLLGNRALKPEFSDKELEESYAVTLGNTFGITDGVKFGILLSGGAGGEDSFTESAVLQPNGVTRDVEEYQRMREWNFYGAAGIRLGEFNEIRASYFKKNITQQNVTSSTRIDGGAFGELEFIPRVRTVFGADADVLGGSLEIDPVEQDLDIRQLSGSHKLGERGPSLSWSVTSSKALEDRPNFSLFRFTTLDFNATAKFDELRNRAIQGFLGQIRDVFPGAPEFQDLDQAGAFLLLNGFDQATVDGLTDEVRMNFPVVNPELGTINTLALSEFTGAAGPGNTTSRTLQSIDEKTDEGSIRLDYPVYFNEDDEEDGFILSAGAATLSKTRQSRGSIFTLVPEFLDPAGERTLGLPADIINGLGEEFFRDPALLSGFLTGFQAGSPFFQDDTLGGLLNLINNVDGSQEVDSYHVSGNLFFGETFLTGGARFESELRTAEILEPRPALPPELLFPAPVSEKVILPSVQAGTSLFEKKLKVVGAWSRTVARPTFYEFLPTRSVDLSTGQVRIGNPALANAEVVNYDLSAEYALGEDMTLRMGLFKKEITDPIIEERRDPDTIGYSNGDVGNIRGVELEAELRNFGPFSLSTNITYIDAELIYTVLSQTGDIVTTAERFPFQPEWILNANLGYENEERDIGINLVYNFTGEYATVLRRVDTDANVLQSGLHSLDLQIRKGFDYESERRLEISAGVKNLFATDREFTYLGGGERFDGETNRSIASQRSYFLEAKFSF